MKISVDGKIGDIDMTVDAMLIPYLLMKLNDVGEYIVNLSDEDATSINENFGVDIRGVKELIETLTKSKKECIDKELIEMIAVALARDVNDDRYVDMMSMRSESKAAETEVVNKYVGQAETIANMVKVKYDKLFEILSKRKNIQDGV
jgi:hypothetical protein